MLSVLPLIQIVLQEHKRWRRQKRKEKEEKQKEEKKRKSRRRKGEVEDGDLEEREGEEGKKGRKGKEKKDREEEEDNEQLLLYTRRMLRVGASDWQKVPKQIQNGRTYLKQGTWLPNSSVATSM